MLVKEFIKSTLINGIKEATLRRNGYARNAYIGFLLVSQSIEFLGACFDEYDFGDSGLSEKRFRVAINKLWPESYQKYNKKYNKYDLYENLRCPFTHQIRPGKNVLLSERKHEVSSGVSKKHFTFQNGKLILIYEDFLSDFEKACQKIVSMIEEKKVSLQKVYSEYLNISQGGENYH